ncbi:MAG: Arm DNA-binding domain-containing protein, partial [Cardiobacteriaceae bacterium]|nr:Arm DNA-binding domain-containing protein [Cardiobacteriaceae bacterium]
MLTDSQIKRLRPQSTRYRVQDIDGLALSVWPSGAMTWVFRYQVAGKRRDMTLGKYPAVSLRDARSKVAELRLSLDRGENIYMTQTEGVLRPLPPQTALHYPDIHNSNNIPM